MPDFTEQAVERFFDLEGDDLYRSFWASDGSMHWGYFGEL